MKWGIERSPLLTKMSELPVCGRRIRQQYDAFLRLKYEINWRWGSNSASRRSLRSQPPKLNNLQQRLVNDLLATGVAKCHIKELLEDSEQWTRLCNEISNFSSSEEVQAVVEQRQRDFEQKRDFRAVEHYIITRYPQDRKPLITAADVLLKFGLKSLILDVVNTYLGLWSKLIYFDMWHTLPLDTDTRFLSQRWHRDPEDRRKIRTFLYFNEVDADAGAMEYFLGTQSGGSFENVFPWKDPLTTPYPPDGEIERQMPASQHVVLDGSPGTLIFCDTAGFHRGGVARKRPRILATAAYVTPASLHRQRYVIDSSVLRAPLSAPARFAVM